MDDGTTILLADDDEGQSLLILNGLRKTGFDNEVVRFRNGQEILDFLGEGVGAGGLDPLGTYVLLLDIRMPRADGVEVLRKVRQAGRLKELPVVMLSTTSAPEEIDLCQSLGCDAFMVKPIPQHQFLDMIESIGDFLRNAPALRRKGFLITE